MELCNLDGNMLANIDVLLNQMLHKFSLSLDLLY